MHASSDPEDFYASDVINLTYDVSDPPDLLCIEVNITDDSYLESEEFFYLQLNSSDPYVKFKIDHSIVEIVDDDCKFVGLIVLQC